MYPENHYKYNNKFLLKVSFISALGGYLFGFDFAVIAGALPFLQHHFDLNAYWEGFATGSLAIGAIIGCAFAGWMADKHGRRKSLMIAAAVFMLSSLGMAISPDRDVFIIARSLAGVGVGMASMLSPMYIAELAPAPVRGRMVALNQLTIVLGILITNLINYQLINLGEESWRWMFGLGAFPSALFFLGTLILPESPRWQLKKGLGQQAVQTLTRIGGAAYALSVSKTLSDSSGERSSRNHSIFHKAVLPAVIAGTGLAIFQQMCGINVVFNYTPRIFESIGASQNDQILQTVFIGGINTVFTLLAIALVDKVGRKPLMLIGSGGLAITYILIVHFLHLGSTTVTWFLLSAIGIYAMSLAPVTWVLISEIFPDNVRDKATSVAVIFLWVAYFILVFTFPSLFDRLKDQTFYIYSAICFTGFIFIYFRIKETKGKSLGENTFTH